MNIFITSDNLSLINRQKVSPDSPWSAELLPSAGRAANEWCEIISDTKGIQTQYQ